jgi:mannosyl-3-phosphoglycerate phosphatase
MPVYTNADKQSTVKTVIFTDLDGTLLDRKNFSFEAAAHSLNYLKDHKIPVIFCSAKTRQEQEYYRQKMGMFHPFIVENGGAIYIPEDYFHFRYKYNLKKDNYHIIELGISHDRIRKVIEKIRTENSINIRGFSDLTAEEIASFTGMTIDMAVRAREREYDEAIIPLTNRDENKRMLAAIVNSKLNYTSGGSLYEVMGNNDKGKAISILNGLFHKQLGKIITVGIGDNLNDSPMLQQVDMPFLVQKPDGKWEDIDIKGKEVYKINGIGPQGWSKIVNEQIKQQLNCK